MAERRPAKFDRVELEEFTRVLKEIVFSEREVESAKIELALKSDFNLIDAFRLFEYSGTGVFKAQDLADGLKQNLQFHDFTSDDIYLFYRRFDRENKGSCTFNDFGSCILPFSREYAALVTDRPDYYTQRERHLVRYFNADTRHELQAFWSCLLRAERSMEALRVKLAQRPYFNIREAFEYCTRSREG